MKGLSLPLLADENIDARVVHLLRERGIDVVTVHDEKLVSADDSAVLQRAHLLGRVVLTQDADFGTLAIRDRQPFIGLIYIRPGDLRPPVVLDLLDAVGRSESEVTSPFIVVAERRGETIRIRFRSLAAG